MSTALAKTQDKKSVSLFAKIASKYSIDEAKLLATLKQTAFRQKDGQVSDEQMTALMIVADQYGLNPFTKELYAYPDKHNGIVPVVSVDGWARIINEHPKMDGIEFKYSDELITMPGAKPCPQWCESIITRKDRAKPIVVREYLDEVFRTLTYTNPWQTHTKRFLRHKTVIQGARLAFGFAGIYDEDEAERIIEMRGAEVVDRKPLADGDKGHSVEPEKRKPEKPPYPDDKFKEMLPKWKDLVVNKNKEPKAILFNLQTEYTLTNDQHDKITNIATLKLDGEQQQ